MALNKSGLPPQKNPMSAAVRPGGPGIVTPSDTGSSKPLSLGAFKGAPKAPTPKGPPQLGMKLQKGGSVRGGVPVIPKLPKIPRFK
jgi:hypothetical protein